MSTPRGKTAPAQSLKEGKSTDETMLIAVLKSFDPADGKISMVDFANAMGYTNVKSACNAFNRLKTKHGLKVEKAATKITKPTTPTPKKRGNRRGRPAKDTTEDSASDGAADKANDKADDADMADDAVEAPKEEGSDLEDVA
ncbi:hypothetical protein N7540_003798 [Penicillium herquei]|nr:hypothetical protein N7540_003798 [Penicillium herquei]